MIKNITVNYFGINEDRKALNGFNLLVNHALFLGILAHKPLEEIETHNTMANKYVLDEVVIASHSHPC